MGSSGSCVVIANPLNAIIYEQKEKFGQLCLIIDAQLIENLQSGKPNKEIEQLKLGKFCFIIGHPEFLVADEVKKLFQEEPLSTMVN